MRSKNIYCTGFTLVEILIALSILSIVLLSLFSGVSSCIYAIKGNTGYAKAIIIARNKMNEFMALNMRGADLEKEAVEEYPDFRVSRVTERFEHPFLPSLIVAKKTTVTVFWKEGDKERTCWLNYIYPER